MLCLVAGPGRFKFSIVFASKEVIKSVGCRLIRAAVFTFGCCRRSATVVGIKSRCSIIFEEVIGLPY